MSNADLGEGATGAKPPTGEPLSDRRGLSESTDAPSAASVWLTCPKCGRETDLIRDGVCSGCHYITCGGDLASDADLAGVWEASLAHAD